MSSADDRKILDKKLALLLGFEDGAADVVDYLLAIESKKDLLDYLSQLLGSANRSSLEAFANDMEHFRQGIALEAIPEQNDSSSLSSEKPKASKKDDSKAEDPKKKEKKEPASLSKKAQRQQKPSSISSPKRTDTLEKPKARIKPSQPNPETAGEIKSSLTNQPRETKPKLRAPVKKGKAPVTCGCFGTLHKAIANCLHCGRISCEKEGYSFCSFCEYFVEKRPTGVKPEGVSDAAWQLRESMLQNDRKSAQRTVVVDDHADYYQSGSTWMNAGEEAAAAEREQDRQRQLHQRQHMRMNIG